MNMNELIALINTLRVPKPEPIRITREQYDWLVSNTPSAPTSIYALTGIPIQIVEVDENGK